MDIKHSFISHNYIDNANAATSPEIHQITDVPNNTTYNNNTTTSKSITVKRRSNGRRYRMIMDGDLTHLSIKKIKRYLQKTTKVPPEEQRLFFNDMEVMQENATGGDLGLYNGAEMIMDERFNNVDSNNNISLSLSKSLLTKDNQVAHNEALNTISPGKAAVAPPQTADGSFTLVKTGIATREPNSSHSAGKDFTNVRPNVSALDGQGDCDGHGSTYREEQDSRRIEEMREGEFNKNEDYIKENLQNRYISKKISKKEIQELDDKWADLDRHRNDMLRHTVHTVNPLDRMRLDRAQTVCKNNDNNVSCRIDESDVSIRHDRREEENGHLMQITQHQSQKNELQQQLARQDKATFDVELAKQKEELRTSRNTIEKLEKKLSQALKDKKRINDQLWEAEDTIRAMKKEQTKEITRLRKQMTEELEEREERMKVVENKRISALLGDIEAMLTNNNREDFEASEVFSQSAFRSMLTSIYGRIEKQWEKEEKFTQELRQKRSEVERSANMAKVANSRALQFEAESLKVKRQLKTLQQQCHTSEGDHKGLHQVTSSTNTISDEGALITQKGNVKRDTLVPTMLKHLTNELHLDTTLYLDENDTCIVTIENDRVPFGERPTSSHHLSLLVTHDRTTNKLFLYSTLANHNIPPVSDSGRDADYMGRLEVLVSLYETLLGGALLGKEMAGGGVGLHQGNRLVLISVTFDLNHCDEFALAASAGSFIEAVRRWTAVVADILESNEMKPCSQDATSRCNRPPAAVTTGSQPRERGGDKKSPFPKLKGGDVTSGSSVSGIRTASIPYTPFNSNTTITRGTVGIFSEHTLNGDPIDYDTLNTTDKHYTARYNSTQIQQNSPQPKIPTTKIRANKLVRESEKADWRVLSVERF